MDVRRDFSSLLEDLIEEPDHGAAPTPRPSVAFDYLAVAEELHSGRIRVSAEAAAGYRMAADTLDAEFDALFGEHFPAAASLPSTDPAAIAAELALDGKDDAGLARARREFALRNHPDRMPVEQRDCALQRMQVANALIDEAHRRLAKAR